MEDLIPILAGIAGLISVAGLFISKLANKSIEKKLISAKAQLESISSLEANPRVRSANTEAIKGLLASLESTDNAVVQIGNLLVIKRKHDGKEETLVRSLTNEQLEYLQNRQSLLSEPKELINYIWESSSNVTDEKKSDATQAQ